MHALIDHKRAAAAELTAADQHCGPSPQTGYKQRRLASSILIASFRIVPIPSRLPASLLRLAPFQIAPQGLGQTLATLLRLAQSLVAELGLPFRWLLVQDTLDFDCLLGWLPVQGPLWHKAGTDSTVSRRSSGVEHALGKGGVECSIHSGGTILLPILQRQI